MTVREGLDKCQLLKEASPATITKIISLGYIKKYKKGELVFREQEAVNRIYFILEGYAYLYKTNHAQDVKGVFVCSDGTMLNEVILEKEYASISCKALTEIEVLSFSRKDFLEMTKEDQILEKNVIESMAYKIRKLYHQLGNTNNSMRLERQVAAKIYKLGKDYGVETTRGIEIKFDFSITFLAELVGSKRETISRIVKHLSKEGYIFVEHNTWYVKKLEDIRGFVHKK